MAKRNAPQPSYDNDGDINNSGSTSSINNSDDAATALGPPHKKSKKWQPMTINSLDDVASTGNDDYVVELQPHHPTSSSSSSVRGRSDDRRENRDTAMKASASSGGRIPTNIISTLQSARKNNAQVANDNNDNAFLKSTREEKIHEPIAVLSKDNDDNDNATTTTTTKPRAPTLFAAPSSLLMNGRSTTNVGQGSGKRLVLYLSLLVLNITTLIIELIVIINGLSNKSYDDTLYDQYMGQVQQIESSILQCHKDEMLLLSSVRKLEQDVHLILQRSVVAIEEIDFIVPIMDGDDNTTTTTIQSREDEYARIENGRILLDVERNRGMNIIWSTTIDEIKNDILSPYYDDDTSTPPPPVVINDEKTSTTLMDAHTAGKIGDISALIAIATKDIMLLHIYDNNGWTPLHEAARGGHLEAVQFLVVEVGLDKVNTFASFNFMVFNTSLVNTERKILNHCIIYIFFFTE